MNAGRLKWPITIEHTEEIGRGFYGQQQDERATLIRTRADIRHDRGSRIEENGEIFHPYDITFIVWDYIYPMISDYDRVVWNGRRYIISSLEPVRETKILYIKCTLENE